MEGIQKKFNNRNNEIFRPKKSFLIFAGLFFSSCTLVIINAIIYGFNGGVRTKLFLSLPPLIQWILVIFLVFFSLIPFYMLLPNKIYVKVSEKGIIYKPLFNREIIIPWWKINCFYLQPNPMYPQFSFMKSLKIKFEEGIYPNHIEENIYFPGKPKLMQNKLNEYLDKYK